MPGLSGPEFSAELERRIEEACDDLYLMASRDEVKPPITPALQERIELARAREKSGASWIICSCNVLLTCSIYVLLTRRALCTQHSPVSNNPHYLLFPHLHRGIPQRVTRVFRPAHLLNSPESLMALVQHPVLCGLLLMKPDLVDFVYLQGRSGRRYVFSSIRREQVSLYDHALLASSVLGSDEVQVSTSLTDLPADFSTLYVHLLDSEVCDAAGALDDLGARNLQDA